MKSLKLALASVVTLFATALSAHAEKAPLALDGYCPVCYVAANAANKGSAEFAAEHGGHTYHFVNAQTMKMFQAEPEKFLPQYDGLCAYGLSIGKKLESDPTVFSVIDGKVYLNKNAEVGQLFAKGTAGHIAKADAAWKKAMAMEKEKMMKDKK